MTGIAGLALGPIAGAALRFPRTAAALGGAGSFVKRHWKWFAGAAVIVALGFATVRYLDNRDTMNRNAGFAAAEAQYREALLAANERAEADQNALNLVTQRFAFLAENRERDVTTIVKPQIERITREVQVNPVYAACLLTDGVFDATNAAGAAVNASIGAGAPKPAR